MVIHHSSPKQIHALIIRKLNMIDSRTIRRITRTIIHLIRIANKPYTCLPIPNLLRPIRISLVPRIPGQPRPNIKETPIRNRVLVIISIIKRENLPPQSASTSRSIPACSHRIKHRLRERQPPRLAARRVLEFLFGRGHGCHAPEALVVISFCFGLVGGHVVVVGADLGEQCLLHYVVVGRVAGVVPVVDHDAEHAACFPPVVGGGQVAGCVACVVACVVFHGAVGDGAGCAFDRCWISCSLGMILEMKDDIEMELTC